MGVRAVSTHTNALASSVPAAFSVWGFQSGGGGSPICANMLTDQPMRTQPACDGIRGAARALAAAGYAEKWSLSAALQTKGPDRLDAGAPDGYAANWVRTLRAKHGRSSVPNAATCPS